MSVVTGSGGNIAVLAGRDGLLLVDAGYATARTQLLANLARASAAANGDAGIASPETVRVAYVVDTHWHADHTDGNAFLHEAGALVVAHESTLLRLSTTQTGEILTGGTATFPPAPMAARPGATFADRKTLHFDGQTVLLEHYLPSHTDGDVSVRFVEADVLHTGDTWFNGMYPFIDYAAGGSIDGMIAATRANIAAVSDATLVIPGHGPVGGRAQLLETLSMLTTIRTTVAELKAHGATREEVIARKPSAAFDARFRNGPTGADVFVGLVYEGT